MSKSVVSWIAFNNDFMYNQKGNLRQDLEQVNEQGPTFSFHQSFWKEGGYQTHYLLYNNNDSKSIDKVRILKEELTNNFKNRRIIQTPLSIDSPIDVTEIFTKLQVVLIELDQENMEAFISPGTPAMQTAWYLLGSHFKERLSLFQIPHVISEENLIKSERIYVSIENSILPTNIVVAKKELNKKKSKDEFFITESLKDVYNKAEMIARTNDVGCLILGENGTGKEHLATFIHENSNRRDKPFLAVNCSAFSDDLLRSELFGHEKGSFTGADKKKTGVFEASQGGTVFLDEIGDISKKMQVSLLRVLQSKKIQKVGSTQETEIDVRILAATNKNIESMSSRDEFRMDLFFRLSVTELRVPSLKERGISEIKALINYFNERFQKRFFDKDKLIFSKEALNKLINHDYKGNVRELENIFIQLYTFCDRHVDVKDLPKRVTEENTNSLSLAENEKQHILKVYALCKEKPIVTANRLRINKATLYRKLKEYGVKKGE